MRRQVLLALVTLSAAKGTFSAGKAPTLRFFQGDTQSPAVFFARVETSKGAFLLEIHRDWAPLGADRFYELARSGYYDDTRFSRVVPNFIVQFGIARDSTTNGKWMPATFPHASVP